MKIDENGEVKTGQDGGGHGSEAHPQVSQAVPYGY
jgi:hypothetical protein